jgi:ParB/RepB/Spo0J family partition protein
LPANPKESRLRKLNPKDIIANKENPRVIFDKEDLGYLKNSIEEVGILVPLTIFKRAVDSKYVLLDGERRWRCALSLGLREVPCNEIEEPTQLENILRMFNIHKTRIEWELIPTALKLETIMRLLGSKSNAELARLTGMSSIRVGECKRVLAFPRKYLDLALLPDKERRITGDFFSQLYRFFEEIEKIPELRNEFTLEGITDIMIARFRDGTLPAILDFRILKNALADARKMRINRKHVIETTRAFLKSEPPRERLVTTAIETKVHPEREKHTIEKSTPMSPREYYEAATGSTYVMDTIVKNAKKLYESLRELRVEEARHNESLLAALRDLRQIIDKIIGK